MFDSFIVRSQGKMPMSTEKVSEEKTPEAVKTPEPKPSVPKSPLDILFTHLKSRDFKRKNEAIKKSALESTEIWVGTRTKGLFPWMSF